MLLRPPESTLAGPLFPDLTLCRSSAGGREEFDCASEEDPRLRILPPRLRGWKMSTDVALADSAEYGIGERVHRGIGIGMSGKPLRMRDADSAQEDRKSTRLNSSH